MHDILLTSEAYAYLAVIMIGLWAVAVSPGWYSPGVMLTVIQ